MGRDWRNDVSQLLQDIMCEIIWLLPFFCMPCNEVFDSELYVCHRIHHHKKESWHFGFGSVTGGLMVCFLWMFESTNILCCINGH
jgi:hypothetical protein